MIYEFADCLSGAPPGPGIDAIGTDQDGMPSISILRLDSAWRGSILREKRCVSAPWVGDDNMNKRRFSALLAALLAIVALPAGVAAHAESSMSDGSPQSEWVAAASPILTLANSVTWIVQGQRLPSGTCGYTYVDPPATIPVGGWVRQTIADDESSCQQMMQSGNPTDQAAFLAVAGMSGQTPQPSLSRRGAWQSVIFFDLFGIQLTVDATQIYWSYNGSTVSSGTTTGTCTPSQSWWYLNYCNHSGSYPTGSYEGQSSSAFHSLFCAPLPTTYIYYYYNRVWGHPDGTAAIAQSSDAVDECLVLHNNIYTGYN